MPNASREGGTEVPGKTENGVVLEVRGQEVIVLTQNGEFKRQRVSRAIPRVGQEIPLRAVSRWNWYRYGSVAAAVLLLAVLLPILHLVPGTTPAAYVSMDINPSVEMALDDRYQVVKANPLNREGAEILGKIEITGLPADEAVAKITSEAVREGYIAQSKNNRVLITVSDEKDNPVSTVELAENLKKSASKVLARDNLSGTVQSVKTDTRIRKEARDVGLSTGKYMVLLESLKQDLPLSPSDLRNTSISKALDKVGADADKILTEVSLEQELGKVSQQLKDRIGPAQAANGDLSQQPEETDDGKKARPITNQPVNISPTTNPENGSLPPGPGGQALSGKESAPGVVIDIAPAIQVPPVGDSGKERSIDKSGIAPAPINPIGPDSGKEAGPEPVKATVTETKPEKTEPPKDSGKEGLPSATGGPVTNGNGTEVRPEQRPTTISPVGGSVYRIIYPEDTSLTGGKR